MTLGQWVPALLLIGFSYVSSDNAEIAVALLTIAVGINAAPYLGFQVLKLMFKLLLVVTNCSIDC